MNSPSPYTDQSHRPGCGCADCQAARRQAEADALIAAFQRIGLTVSLGVPVDLLRELDFEVQP